MRINVVGTSGSGKTTLCKEIAKKISLPYIEMDQLFWGPGWTQPAKEDFILALEKKLDQPNWLLDGNYDSVIPVKWKSVDIVIWIDYSLTRTLLQALKRALVRAYSQKELWPGTDNRESFRQLLSRDSILLWALKTYHSNRKKYLSFMADKDYQHIQFIQLRSPKQVKNFIDTTHKLVRRYNKM